MKEFVCIVCPNGCHLTVESESPISIVGARCPKGKAYAEQELTNPTRSITSTVKTIFAEVPVLPVRTNGEIPKNMIFEVMKEINAFVLEHRAERGEILINNIANTGINLIATSNALKLG